ncbi:MAG: hypothetical protein Q8J64_05400 [Thermodesulfovibrionales bacterium]|nr:hypothetical protein [Thermodesulfovibrionales bacterium]
MRRLIDILSSRALFIWLITGWTVYYVTNAVWSKEAFAGFIEALGKNPLVQAPYVIFLLSFLLNIIRVFKERAKKRLVNLLIWMVLPSGIFMFFTGYFLSSTLRHYEQALVGEGEAVSPKWLERKYSVRKMIPSLKNETLETGQAESSIFSFEPKVVLSREGRDFEVGVFPPRNIDGTYYHILNFGLAPGVRLSNSAGVVKEGYLALRILPPGAEDGFELEPYPYRFSLRIAPERVMEKGGVTARVYSLKSPSYNIVILKGDETVFEGGSKEGINFEGFSLSFFEPTYWALLEVVKDPGMPVIIAGLALIALGIPLRLLGLLIRVIRA